MKAILVTASCYIAATALTYLGANALAATLGLSPDFTVVISF